jgi:uncharacterized protein YkwD
MSNRRHVLLSLGLCLQLVAVSLFAFQRRDQPEIRIPDLERRVHDLVNSERANKKANKLDFDRQLAEIARAHSADMARRQFFDHTNPDGKNATDRGRVAGYLCQKFYSGFFTQGLAENIYRGNLYSRIRITGSQRTYDWYSPEEIAREVVEGWMDSTGHRRNILEKTYGKEGIGIFIDADDRVYVTQVFC